MKITKGTRGELNHTGNLLVAFADAFAAAAAEMATSDDFDDEAMAESFNDLVEKASAVFGNKKEGYMVYTGQDNPYEVVIKVRVRKRKAASRR